MTPARRPVSSFRIVVAIAAFALGGLAFAPIAQAQVGYDDSVAQVVLGSEVADSDGTATTELTLPEDITEPYEIVAVGVDAAGEELIVLATVISVNGRQVVVSASGFAPGSDVIFVVRYVPAEGPDDGGVDGGGSGGSGGGSGGNGGAGRGTGSTGSGRTGTSGTLPRTGTEPMVLAGMGAGMLLLGGAAIIGSRRRAGSVIPT